MSVGLGWALLGGCRALKAAGPRLCVVLAAWLGDPGPARSLLPASGAGGAPPARLGREAGPARQDLLCQPPVQKDPVGEAGPSVGPSTFLAKWAFFWEISGEWGGGEDSPFLSMGRVSGFASLAPEVQKKDSCAFLEPAPGADVLANALGWLL